MKSYFTLWKRIYLCNATGFSLPAFESYERFIKSTYAILGYVDKRFWTCTDYGDISADKISRLPRQWYLDQIRRKQTKFSLDVILKNIRKICTHLHTYEDNEYEVRRWMGVATYFRHLIVHNHGQIPKDVLWARLEEHTGYSLTGKSKAIAIRRYEISQYLQPKTDEYFITMIDRTGLEKKGHGVDAPLRRMIEYLASHALLIYSELSQHFEFTPYWEKSAQHAPPGRVEAPRP